MKLLLSTAPFARHWSLLVAGGLLASSILHAFPPAPHHLIYGVVRDEYGTPVVSSAAQVLLQTPTGTSVKSSILPGIAPGINYELEVPMDAGLTSDPYEPQALKTSAPFKIFVIIGPTTNLPIQMTGNFALLGQPGQMTRMDLTLGIDSNADGLRDAWELAFLAVLGSNLSLSDLRPGMDLANDGLTLQQEYLVGAFPFDPGDSFALHLLGFNGPSPLLQFTSMTGRSYSIFGSRS